MFNNAISIFLPLFLIGFSAQAANSVKKNSAAGHFQSELGAYTSNLKMRDDRKVGVGMAVGGSLGLIGINADFNFEDADGVLIGFGSGSGYRSFQIAWRHSIEGDFLSPFTSLGYSRWYNSSGTMDYKNSDILKSILTEKEKITGQFGTDFINASIGLQYGQLSGDWQGFSFYGEFTATLEVKRAKLIPNGSVGSIYYF